MNRFLFGFGLFTLGLLCFAYGGLTARGQMPGTFIPAMTTGGGLACTPNTQGGGNDSNVIGLWHFDNNGTDKSQGNHNLTLNSGATFSNVQSKFGGYSYKGATASSSASIGGIVYNGITDFTVEYWLYHTTALSGANFFMSDGNTGAIGTTFAIDWGYSSGQKTEIDAPSTSVSAYAPTATTLIPTLNTWHHWAWVRKAAVYTFYYDGVAQPTTSNSAPSIGNGTAAWTIANYANGGASGFKDYMDEFRFSNVARYTANFTPQTLAFCDTAYVPPPPGHPWNPADKTSNTTLSNNNYDIVANSDSSAGGARTTVGVSTGKVYFELKALTTPRYTSFGIATTAFLFNGNYVGTTTASAGFRADGAVAFTATGLGSAANPFSSSGAINDVWGFAVDMTNKQMWVSKNNTWLGSGAPNPATGSQANLISIPAVTVFPVIVPYWTGSQDKWSLQDGVGTPLTYTPPSGFTAYGSQ